MIVIRRVGRFGRVTTAGGATDERLAFERRWKARRSTLAVIRHAGEPVAWEVDVSAA